jgi:undecaprenyl diphosphate synthase
MEINSVTLGQTPASHRSEPGGAVLPQHIAIIMDGNGRWAAERGLPRLAGHRAGVRNVRPLLRACVERHISYLTLYAFSTENWSRPAPEVNGLMGLLGEYIDREMHALHEAGVQVRHVGRLDGLPSALQRKVRDAVQLTQHNTTLTVAVALNYGGRAEIIDAVRAMVADQVPPAAIDETRFSEYLTTRGMPDPDLIIRTSGEWRMSNFLVWQAAYSEYWATDVLWPDFSPDDLDQALRAYAGRRRRFGGLGGPNGVGGQPVGSGAGVTWH